MSGVMRRGVNPAGLDYLATSRAVAHQAARETLQQAARGLRSISVAAGGQNALLAAAHQVEAILEQLDHPVAPVSYEPSDEVDE